MPSPLQDSHRPPFTLKLKRPFLYPRIFASFVVANKSRISSNTPVYVAGLLRGVLPIGLWSISIILSRLSNPEMLLNFPGFSFVRVISRAKAFFNTLLISYFPQRLLNGSSPYLPCDVRLELEYIFYRLNIVLSVISYSSPLLLESLLR